MPRLSIFLAQKNVTTNAIEPRIGLTDTFLQPQKDITSVNPSSMSQNSESIALIESGTSPGVYYADILNPCVRYDLYIGGSKDSVFSGNNGFNLPSSKSIYFKKNVEIDAEAYAIPEGFETGVGVLATPDGGQTWPKFSSTNLPMIIVLAPSENVSGMYMYRIAKIVRGSVSVNGSGNLIFSIALDPNGPTLANYYCDIMVVIP